VTNAPIDDPRQRWIRNATKPLTAFFDQRFTDLHEHLDHRIDVLESRLEHLEALVGSALEPAAEGGTLARGERVDELITRVQRFSDEFAARAERIAHAYEELAARARNDG
jgi:hypothetical protein